MSDNLNYVFYKNMNTSIVLIINLIKSNIYFINRFDFLVFGFSSFKTRKTVLEFYVGFQFVPRQNSFVNKPFQMINIVN